MRRFVRIPFFIPLIAAAASMGCRERADNRPSPEPTAQAANALHATPGGVDILTFHGDNARTGWNNRESTLTPDNVRPETFGRIAVAPDVADEVMGQPLFASNINVHDGRTNADTMADVVFVATMDNRVYALDSDNLETLWVFDFEGHRPPVASSLQACQSDYHIGAMSTPVISPDRSTIYAVGRVFGAGGESDAWLQGYALSTRDGSITARFRVGETVGAGGARVPVTFDGFDRGMPVHIQYEPNQYTQRSALLLVNNTLYVTNGGICDVPGFRGWVLAYDVTHLSESTPPSAVFVPSPGGGAGMWAAGGPASDGNSVFVVTGNGFAAIRAGTAANARSFGDAVVRLGLDLSLDSNACFSVAGGDTCGAGDATNLRNVFMPRHAELLSSDTISNMTGDIQGPDEDFGSSGALLVPSATLPENMAGDMGRHLAAVGGKDGFFYLIDRDRMGGVGPSPLATDADIPNLVGAELDAHEVFMHSTSGGIRLNAAYFESHTGRYLYVNGADSTLASDAAQGTVAFRIVPGADPTTDVCNTRFREIAYQRMHLPCNTIWGSQMRPTLEVAWSGTGGTLAGSPFVSSNGNAQGIVWSTIEHGADGNGVLVAYAADSGSGTGAQLAPIYRSDRHPDDRMPGPSTTFAGPVVANGRVYVTGSTFLAMYGPVDAREVPPLPDPPAPADCAPGISWESTAQNFMNRYCVSCHSEYTRLGFIQRRRDRVAESILPAAGGSPRMPLVHDPAMPPPLPTDDERAQIAAWLHCGAPATAARVHAGFNDIDAPAGAFLSDATMLDPNRTGTLSMDRLVGMSLENAFAPAYPDALFRTDRTGPTQIRIPIPGTGHYAVTALFAENACTTGGTECHIPFDVQVAGQPWLTGFDILAAAGAPRRVVARSTTVDVPNGSQLRVDVGAAGKIQAIEVVRTDPCTTDMTCPVGFACMGGMCMVNPERADGGVGGDVGIREDGPEAGTYGDASNGLDGSGLDGGSAEGGGNTGCHCHVAGTPRGTSSRVWIAGVLVALVAVTRRRKPCH